MHIQSYSMINRRTRKTLYISRQTRSFAVLASTSHVAPPLQYHVTWRSSQKSTAFQVQRGKLKLSNSMHVYTEEMMKIIVTFLNDNLQNMMEYMTDYNTVHYWCKRDIQLA